MSTHRGNFEARKRERFLDEASFDWNKEYTENEELPLYEAQISDASNQGIDRATFKRYVASSQLSHTILLYSGGSDLASLRANVLATIQAFDNFLSDDYADLVYVDLAIQDYYVEALWLLSLTKMLGYDQEIERVVGFYLLDETNIGADELFEAVRAKLGLPSAEAEGLIHEDPYQHLLDAIKAEPDARPEHMQLFLQHWYKGMKECGWWGSHVRRPGTTVLDTGFFGYWAFEAGLVTYLWDIDDSSYRDMQHYPKDLVDYARAHFPLNTPKRPPTLRALPGVPCPQSGTWLVAHTPSTARHFNKGDVMPELNLPNGETIWTLSAD